MVDLRGIVDSSFVYIPHQYLSLYGEIFSFNIDIILSLSLLCDMHVRMPELAESLVTALGWSPILRF